MTAEAVQAELGLDSGTRLRLEAFVELLEKWQKRINLVAPNTIPDVWTRHILDSAQLFGLLEGRDGPLLDFGSGAGFPGLILAILGRDDVTLVEADRRKSAFLAEAARVTETQVSIETCRIESLRPIRAGIITARALAPVEKLLAYGEAYSDESTLYALLKGERADQELMDATTHWKMSVRKVPSRSDSRGTVLLLEGVIHA